MGSRPIAGLALVLAGCSSGLGGDPQPVEDRDPGRVTLHRLNRAEYNNTVRDLLGDTSRPADDFPSDDFGYGFDNIGDVLSISPLLLEKYELAAQGLVEAAVRPPFEGPTAQVFEAESLTSEVGAATEDAWDLWANGQLSATVQVAIEGEYALSARAWGQQAGSEPARMELTIDGVSLATFDVPNVSAGPGIFSRRAHLTAGAHTFDVAFVNDYYAPPDDRNLFVDWLEAEGPFDAPPPENPQIYAQIMICDPVADGRRPCAGEIIEAFATRAWRRPPTPEEVERLLQLTDMVNGEGDDFDTQIAVALQAILLSPSFVFRVELDPTPHDLTPHPLTDWELASRLSYFLWSSMPDAELFALAEQGELSDPDTLAAQVERMIRDPKSAALIENFVGQWLSTRALEDVNPDSARYPDWDAELKDAMGAETKAFVKEFLTTDRSALEMLSSDFTYVNDRLARHYGLPPVGSDSMVRVHLTDDRRGGLLTQASLLTVTSHPRRTSPVKRGKFVLEHLLCQRPPDPPADVTAFPEAVDPDASLRERFEAHRSEPRCQPCHQLMDPIGFALEHYDGIGAWREDDQGYAIDATGTLIDGSAFDGGAELSKVIMGNGRLPECMARQLMTYGLGRGLVPKDDPWVDDVVGDFAGASYSLESLLISMTRSGAFTRRRGEAE